MSSFTSVGVEPSSLRDKQHIGCAQVHLFRTFCGKLNRTEDNQSHFHEHHPETRRCLLIESQWYANDNVV